MDSFIKYLIKCPLYAQQLTYEVTVSPLPCHLLPLIFCSQKQSLPWQWEYTGQKGDTCHGRTSPCDCQVSDYFPSALPLGPFLIFSWSGYQELVGQNTSRAATFMTDHNCYKFPHVRPDRFLSRHYGRWQSEDHETKDCFLFLFLHFFFKPPTVSLWLNEFKENLSL